MKQLAIILPLLITLIPLVAGSQELEELWEAAGTDPSIQTHFAALEENPIDLNRATANQLQEALFLDPLLIAAIIAYRDRHYPLKATDEILNIPGITLDVYQAIAPYITVEIIPQPVRISSRVLTRYYRRYPHSRGYSEQQYLGDPVGASHQIVLSRGNVSWGGVIQKDPGEFRWNDHQALYLRADGMLTPNDRWILGNYRLGFGQGLVLSNGFRLSATTADPMAILPRHPIGVREFASTSEYQFFQGAAYQNRLNNLTWSLFVSRVFRDARTDSGSTVATFYTTGLHRSSSEEDTRRQLREDLWGGHLELTTNRVSAGITAYQVDYRPDFGAPDSITQHYQFSGDRNSVIGANLTTRLGLVKISGEIAQSQSGGIAALVEGTYDIHAAQVGCIYRWYDPEFQNFHAVTLSEWGDDAANEEGWLLAVKLPLWRGADLSSRADIFRSPWRTYAFPFPRHGTGVIASLHQKFGEHTFSARLKGSQVEDVEDDTIVDEIRLGTRLQWDWKESTYRAFRLRWERITFDTPAMLESGTGWMLYGQTVFGNHRRLTAKFRITTFDVPVYGARIYTYEDDLPGRLVNQLFYGQGRRLSSRIKWVIAPGWNLWLKTAFTTYHGVDKIGSGWDEIPANQTYDVGIALQWKRS